MIYLGVGKIEVMLIMPLSITRIIATWREEDQKSVHNFCANILANIFTTRCHRQCTDLGHYDYRHYDYRMCPTSLVVLENDSTKLVNQL